MTERKHRKYDSRFLWRPKSRIPARRKQEVPTKGARRTFPEMQAIIRKASQKLTEKGIGKVTNLCTWEGNRNKNYLSELKGQWGAGEQVAKSLKEEHRIARRKAGSEQLCLRGALCQGALHGVCSNSESYSVDWNESCRKDQLTSMQGASS